MKTLAEAFHHTLQDLYYAEAALTKALPKVASAAIKEKPVGANGPRFWATARRMTF